MLKEIKLSLPRGLDLAKSQTDEFHKVFGHLVSDKPTLLTKDQIGVRVQFLAEELVELLSAVADTEHEFIRSVTKLINAIDDAEVKELDGGIGKKDDLEKIVAVADALTDINYFTQGTFTMIGVNPQPLFDIVQDANMAKLGSDGKPIYRESDGKIMKPEGWQPPEPKLAAEIKRQMEEK